MGLARLDGDAEWLELDAAWAEELREKRRLLRTHPDLVFVETPHSRPAQREILELVVSWLNAHQPHRIRVAGSRLEIPALGEQHALDGPLAPLDLAARLVQEDLCVMERGEGAWRLTAASVCFPTRWDLPSKLGLSLAAIHAPVPGYCEALARSADRFFDGMTCGPIVWRSNWSLLDDPTLFQPAGSGVREPNRAVTAENAGDRLWLRVERQTLRRVPVSDAILFTIRVHQSPLRALAEDGAQARSLAGAMRSMPPELQVYKSLPAVRDAALAYLEARIVSG